MKKDKAARTALGMIITTWYVVLNIFLATYVRLNWLPNEYEGTYWTAVGVYAFGMYMAITYYFIFKKDDE